jgi:hypothetical protein
MCKHASENARGNDCQAKCDNSDIARVRLALAAGACLGSGDHVIRAAKPTSVSVVEPAVMGKRVCIVIKTMAIESICHGIDYRTFDCP